MPQHVSDTKKMIEAMGRSGALRQVRVHPGRGARQSVFGLLEAATAHLGRLKSS